MTLRRLVKRLCLACLVLLPFGCRKGPEVAEDQKTLEPAQVDVAGQSVTNKVIPEKYESIKIFPIATPQNDSPMIGVAKLSEHSIVRNEEDREVGRWFNVAETNRLTVVGGSLETKTINRVIRGQIQVLVALDKNGLSDADIVQVSDRLSGTATPFKILESKEHGFFELSVNRMGQRFAIVIDHEIHAILPLVAPIRTQFVISREGIDKARFAPVD